MLKKINYNLNNSSKKQSSVFCHNCLNIFKENSHFLLMGIREHHALRKTALKFSAYCGKTMNEIFLLEETD
jgi:hypothetical protein